jgi:hypothetical protein
MSCKFLELPIEPISRDRTNNLPNDIILMGLVTEQFFLENGSYTYTTFPHWDGFTVFSNDLMYS